MSIRASFSSANGMTDPLIQRNNSNNRILPEIFKHRLLNSAEEVKRLFFHNQFHTLTISTY